MLEAYNKRLSEEMEARKSVARMLHDYIAYQKDLLAQAEETLEVKWLFDIQSAKFREPYEILESSRVYKNSWVKGASNFWWFGSLLVSPNELKQKALLL